MKSHLKSNLDLILNSLYQLKSTGVKLGLENTRELLQQIGNPHKHNRIIHFAGTNGKGSTLYTLEQLLISSGHTVGATISPHLVKFNERFRINGKPVNDDSLQSAVQYIFKKLNIDSEKMDDSSEWKVKPTFFEFCIAIAFVIFEEYKVDYILLETGLGGRLDSSNVIEDSIASVITKIDYDHVEFLGNSLEEIAPEKLGIIKQSSKVFISYQSLEVHQIIKNRLQGIHNSVFYAGENYDYEIQKNRIAFNHQQHSFSIKTSELGLQGKHQLQNVSTALNVYFECIGKSNLLKKEEIQKVLKKLQWKGRLEFLDKQKKILIDSAHNSSGIESLYQYLREHHSEKKIAFITFWLKKKKMDSVSLFQNLDLTFYPVADQIEKENNAEIISLFLKEKNLNVEEPFSFLDFPEKITELLNKYELIVIAGSIYFLGEVLGNEEIIQRCRR